MKKALRFVLWSLLALLLTAAVALALIVKIVLAPAKDEWAMQRRIGPLTLDLGVPTLIRLATTPWFAPWLDGRRFDTAHGPVQLHWNEERRQLQVRCAPCQAAVPALGPQPLRLEHLGITVRRDAGRLAGELEAVPPQGTPNGGPLQGRWTGLLTQRDLRVEADLADAPIARWYAVLTPELPELQRAQIGGTAGLKVQFTLPGGAAGPLGVQPRVAQFAVAGLGTEAMLGARTACGPGAGLRADSWLARAVIAAEDQRFFQHPGYDLVELAAAFDKNQHKGGIDRGGSTITQQLAKMLVTGSERTLERKLRELLYAVEMEQTLGKARILQLYLDNAPWGRVCGAEAAARHYFKRPAARLEPAQAVWLASMLHAPGLAAERWAREGTLDPQRLKWVAEGIRGISRAQRAALLRSVDSARYPSPASE
ncbi:biosynthetic peptidoglycan transglycosylase [Xenophilus sp.]|uniref:biosynthetic peptidoglycan transglycosylase n=1 Tax=Xenophilus sp. TaxID=1873499 RepID=UPI0037DCC160